MFILGVWGLEPSACKSLLASLNSSQKSGCCFSLLFCGIFLGGVFFFSNFYGIFYEIRNKNLLQPSNELISQWFLWELLALILPQMLFWMQSPFFHIEFWFLLSLCFLIIKQADSNQFFYSVIPSYLPKCHHQPAGLAKSSGSHKWSMFYIHDAALSSCIFMTLSTVSLPEQPELCYPPNSMYWRTD